MIADMRLIDRLVTVLTVVIGLPAVAGAIWLLRDQPEWVWWIAGPAVGGMIGGVIGWVAYGS